MILFAGCAVLRWFAAVLAFSFYPYEYILVLPILIILLGRVSNCLHRRDGVAFVDADVLVLSTD